MKTCMMKIREYLQERVWRMITLGVCAAVISAVVWNWSLQVAVSNQQIIKNLVEKENVIMSPIYTQASEVNDGIVLVSEGGGIYYISETGERITQGYYKNGFPFEAQGLYARVQMEDGNWGIIKRNEEVLLEGCQLINELPYVTTIGSVIKNDRALLFRFTYNSDSEEEIKILKEFEEFNEIGPVCSDKYAIVKNREDLYGVVCAWNGDVIVPDSYISIEREYDQEDKDTYKEKIIFKAEKRDGTYRTIVWEP